MAGLITKDSELKENQAEEFVLIGDSTHITMVNQFIKVSFNDKEPIHGIIPDEAGTYGAAVQAGI